MPRKPRFYLPDLPQHVVQRGNNRDPCFYAKSDYLFYLTVLGDALVHHRCRLHAYVLMTNHVHLLVTPLHRFGLPQLMQAIGRRYVQYINRSYRRSGTLWEGRYKASLVDSESWLLTCMRYIEMNPVRAGMVSHPGEYSWSSYACNAQGKACALLTPHVLYQVLGPDPEERRHAYGELFRCSLDDGQVHEIRAVLSQELVLGREDFKDRIAAMTQRRVRRGKDGRPSKKRRREEQSGKPENRDLTLVALRLAGCACFGVSGWISIARQSIIAETCRLEIQESTMSCEGIWIVEMKGPYGWERIAFAFLKNGEYLGAGPNHYSVGTYKEDGDNVEISVVVTQHGQLRTIFGKKFAGKLQITSKCKIEKNKIVGTSKAKGMKSFDVMLRLTKAGDFA